MHLSIIHSCVRMHAIGGDTELSFLARFDHKEKLKVRTERIQIYMESNVYARGFRRRALCVCVCGWWGGHWVFHRILDLKKMSMIWDNKLINTLEEEDNTEWHACMRAAMSEWIEIFRVADPRKPSERSVTETDADQDQLPFAFAQRELPLWSTKQGRPPGSVISQSRLQRLRRFSNACALIIPYSYSKHTYSIDRPLLLSFFLFNK
jgi:hypothetical protein